MPRTKKSDKSPGRTPLLNTRLSAADHLKLELICKMEGLTKTEVLRKATLNFIDSYDKNIENNSRDRLADTLEKFASKQTKDTERLAKMIARVMMDIGIVNQVFYKRAAQDERDKLWESARQAAAERLKHKRKGGDPEAAELVKNALSSET